MVEFGQNTLRILGSQVGVSSFIIYVLYLFVQTHPTVLDSTPSEILRAGSGEVLYVQLLQITLSRPRRRCLVLLVELLLLLSR